MSNTRPGPPVLHTPVSKDTSAANSTMARTTPGTLLDSASLLQGGKAVTIRHNGELYRLQATRQGKLILTK